MWGTSAGSARGEGVDGAGENDRGQMKIGGLGKRDVFVSSLLFLRRPRGMGNERYRHGRVCDALLFELTKISGGSRQSADPRTSSTPVVRPAGRHSGRRGGYPAGKLRKGH